MRALGPNGNLRLKEPEPVNEVKEAKEEKEEIKVAQLARSKSIRRRAAEAAGAGLLQLRIGGALKRNLAEEQAHRRMVAEREERWGVNHPSRARLRALNHQAVDLFLKDARERAFYNQFLPEHKRQAWAERFKEHVLNIYLRSQKSESVAPELLREVLAIQKEDSKSKREKQE